MSATTRSIARRSVISGYMELGKVRLSSLVVATTAVGFAVAPGPVDALRFLSTIVGTTLAALGANSLNQWLERDRDALMERTRTRPLPSGRLSPREALGAGLVESAAGVALLGWAAVSVVCPGSGRSPFKATKLPVTIRVVTATSPPTITQGVLAAPTRADSAPATAISPNVFRPASGDSARSFWSPTSRPRPRAVARFRKVSLSIALPSAEGVPTCVPDGHELQLQNGLTSRRGLV